jgi:hypothetical protein
MAKKTQTVTLEIPQQPPVMQDAVDSEKEIKERLEIEEWISEFQSRFTDQPASILIEKFDDSEWSICRRYPLSTFDYESVRAEFGGGKYRATLIDPKGRYVPEGRNRFKFAESIIKPTETPKPQNPLDNPVVAMMIESMKGQQAQMLEITKSMIATGGAGKGSDIGQLIVALKGLQDLTPKDKPMESLKDTLNMVKLVKEVTGDDGDSKGGLLSEIREFLEVYPVIKEKLAELKPVAPGAPAASVPERIAPVPDPLTEKVVLHIPKFVDAAKAAAPVPQWGKYLLDLVDVEFVPVLLPSLKKQYGPLVQTEDDVYDILIKLAKDPGERLKIYQAIPPLAPYKEWCGRVMDEAIRLAETEEAENVVIAHVEANGDTHDAP